MTEQNKAQASSGGVGFLGLFFLVLFVLKVGVVDSDVRGWSWWWVTAPLWAIPAILLAGFLLWVILKVLAFSIQSLSPKQRKIRKRRKALGAARKKARLN